MNWMFERLEFQNDDLVLIKNTGSKIDGQTGKIKGLAVDHIVRIWIVQLNKRPDSYPFDCATFPGSCLERLDENSR